MNTITLNNLPSKNMTMDTSPNKTLTPIETKKNSSPAAPGISLYDIYGLEEGFSHNLSGADKVTLSPIGRMLSEAQSLAETNRETWADPSKILQGEIEFKEVFKEVLSEDGGLVFRKFNASYLNEIQSAKDALLLYEQISKSDQNGIVVTSMKDVGEVVFKMRAIAAKDEFNSITNLSTKTSEIFDAKEKFVSLLEKEHPSLKGIELEFSLDGNEIVITGGKINGVEIPKSTIADIEDLANGSSGKRLKDAMISFREEAVISFNRYPDSGRKNPIDSADFDKRFGGFSSYLDAFKNTSDNSKTSGPNDPNITRQAYFANASTMIASRLFN